MKKLQYANEDLHLPKFSLLSREGAQNATSESRGLDDELTPRWPDIAKQMSPFQE